MVNQSADPATSHKAPDLILHHHPFAETFTAGLPSCSKISFDGSHVGIFAQGDKPACPSADENDDKPAPKKKPSLDPPTFICPACDQLVYHEDYAEHLETAEHVKKALVHNPGIEDYRFCAPEFADVLPEEQMPRFFHQAPEPAHYQRPEIHPAKFRQTEVLGPQLYKAESRHYLENIKKIPDPSLQAGYLALSHRKLSRRMRPKLKRCNDF
ncbi:unnamed protein product, partial [Mesorhabditis spiculigera]